MGVEGFGFREFRNPRPTIQSDRPFNIPALLQTGLRVFQASLYRERLPASNTVLGFRV